MITSRSFLLGMKKKCSDKRCEENQNTHFVSNDFFFFFENRTVYEIKRKNVVQPGRPQMKTRRMRSPKATNTHHG